MKIVRLKEHEHLSQCDPLYSVLIREVFKPKIHQLDPEFELHCLNHRQDIYLGHELKSDIHTGYCVGRTTGVLFAGAQNTPSGTLF
jgi:hypothetical protein